MTSQHPYLPGWGIPTAVAPARHGGLRSWVRDPAQTPPAEAGLSWLGVGTPLGPADLVVAVSGVGRDAQGRWPAPTQTNIPAGISPLGPQLVVLVAWATVSGAEAALDAATQFARGEAGTDAVLAGVLAVNMPGRTPLEVSRRFGHVSSMVPNVWNLHWDKAWTSTRLGHQLPSTKELAGLLSDLTRICRVSGVEMRPGAEPDAPAATQLTEDNGHVG